MKFHHQLSTLRRLSVIACSAALAACGAGSDQSQNSSVTQSAGMLSSSASSSLAANVLNGPITTTVPPTTSMPASVVGTGITSIGIQNTGTAAQTNVPLTFGQVFAVGHLQAGEQLTGRLDDGSTVPLQVDVKAKHTDGSVRHAVISAVLPNLAANVTRTMSLVKGGSAPAGSTSIDALLRNGFSTSVHAKIGGVDYYASADELLKSTKPTTWLSGPVATEWQVSAPLRTSSGAEHPHLSARFAIRWYAGANKARVDVVVENDWAYEPSPQNFTYDASVIVGGKAVYSKASMTHYHHARWRKLFWYNTVEPTVNLQHDTTYLINSRALPNYDRSVVIPETTLAGFKSKWTGAITEPMAVGLANPSMPGTGGRMDIGLLPGWTVAYLLSMDKRAKDVTLGTADLSGSWSSHYRDRKTGYPISVADHPYMTVYGQRTDTYNKAIGQYEAFPACASSSACASPNVHDPAHQPNFAYVPYLVTGDYYYLEELQFWAMWNSFQSNPSYRQFGKGLYKNEQIRGQAWALRTAAEAAYATPDGNPLKATFLNIVNDNLDFYNTTYTNASGANALGALTDSHAFAYNNGRGLAPWQDDFFTSAVGHTAELGFTKADALLAWKSKFPILRVTGAGTCWIDGAIYALNVRDSSNSPIYNTIAQTYTASHTADILALQCNSSEMASKLGLKVGEMKGYASSTEGYPANMQPALAYAATVGGSAGKSAWTVFANRSVKPNYGTGPQFAIVPR
ncbi:hypothetical protein ACFQ09_15235 [Massilia norwichensis]|uniref:PcRGLX/YetA-like N-terminal RIFT barrel domain-containing protein n=1 Tax=Massilia norwichensis TaxID=1442366 RepID=A0ABT2AAA9_9BURK|nr:hypothetical protein [Massilia norwichensis]MCS0591012.1 hypothetical protein [Massilia norwichensis]